MNDYIIYPKQLTKKSIPIERNHCFFLMPFNKNFDVIYGTIKQYLSDNNFTCMRADEISGSTPIVSKILTNIAKSQYIIVDLTESNANVFYELGIAHTLKEARNVLLLKQKNYEVPFDIKHLTYTEYDPLNLKHISSVICNFLNESRTKNEFYEAMRQHGIINFIDEKDNEFIEIILRRLNEKDITTLTNNLLIDGNKPTNELLTEALLALKKIIEDYLIQKDYSITSRLLNVYFYEIYCVKENEFLRQQVSLMLENYFEHFDIENAVALEYKTRLALLLAKQELYLDIVLPWIINYFSRSKSTTIDLNRYNVESFLLTTAASSIDEAIVNSLCNPDCYVREHMADIIGEKKIIFAGPALFCQLAKEENYFTAQSIIEAIGKIDAIDGIKNINTWVKQHKTDIIKTNQLFVLKHAYNAINKLDKTTNQEHILSFDKEYGKMLREYYII